MNSRRFVFVILACLALITAALCPIPPATSNAQSTATAQQTPGPSLSVSGKITAVGNDSFTLAVGSASTSGSHQFSASEAKSMTFILDKNTAIEGKLRVNANADVTYREENGKNIAISVHVAS